jgi:hypothetical protein
MLDFLIQFLSPLNIDDHYYEIMVALSTFSFFVSLVNFILKQCKVFDPDEIFDKIKSEFIKNHFQRFSITVALFVLDLCVWIFDICNSLVTIPSDFHLLWIVLTTISLFVTFASAGAKFVIASFWLGRSFGVLVKAKLLRAFCFLFFAVWMAFSTIVGLCDTILSFNDVLTTIKTLGI